MIIILSIIFIVIFGIIIGIPFFCALTKTGPFASTDDSASISATLPPQCSSYTTNSDATRNVGYSGTTNCDKTLFSSTGTWVRFSSPAGTTMPTTAPASYSCGTSAAGWYNGAYSSTVGSTISGTVCYSLSGNTCRWSNSIQITYCGSFYVFLLVNTTVCDLRYCAV